MQVVISKLWFMVLSHSKYIKKLVYTNKQIELMFIKTIFSIFRFLLKYIYNLLI